MPSPVIPFSVADTGYNRVHQLDMGKQLLHLRTLGLTDAASQTRHDQLIFEYSAAPTPISRLYRLRLEYRRGARPQVWVLSPDVTDLAKDKGSIPHLYDRNHPVKLCLYLPRTREWRSDRSLAHTIVPWSVEWLLHFEAWLATGVWSGGGEHPPAGDSKK
jgi:hypothetical protein